MRLLSREMLGSEWITLLIVAYSTVMVTFVVVACVIGLPRFAISMSEPVVRSEERLLPHGDFRSAIWQRFLRILYSLGKAVFTGLHGDRWSCPALGYRCCGEPHGLITLCDRLLQVHFLDDFVT